MVEGGASIITSVLSSRLSDQVVVSVSSHLLGGVRAVEPLSRIPAPLRPRLEHMRICPLEEGFVIQAELDRAPSSSWTANVRSTSGMGRLAET